MAGSRRVVFHFEQGSTLDELMGKRSALQKVGWEVASVPRQISVGRGRTTIQCFSQSFLRLLGNDEPQAEAGSGSNAWSPLSSTDHFLQVYDDEQGLLRHLTRFALEGLRTGESVIVISTAEHLEILESRLLGCSVDAQKAKAEGRFQALDASAVLDRFMAQGWPVETEFFGLVSELMEKAKEYDRPVRAFAEVVALLCQSNLPQAALRLEQLWQQACQWKQFPLYCAYPSNAFTAQTSRWLPHLMAVHSRVIC